MHWRGQPSNTGGSRWKNPPLSPQLLQPKVDLLTNPFDAPETAGGYRRTCEHSRRALIAKLPGNALRSAAEALQSSNSDRSRTAPLSADITSLA